MCDAYHVMWAHHTIPGAGGQCTRQATRTNGKRYLCTQHAKTQATVLRKASSKIQEGFAPIPITAYVVMHRGKEERRFADKKEAQKYLRRKRSYTSVNGNHVYTLATV